MTIHYSIRINRNLSHQSNCRCYSHFRMNFISDSLDWFWSFILIYLFLPSQFLMRSILESFNIAVATQAFKGSSTKCAIFLINLPMGYQNYNFLDFILQKYQCSLYLVFVCLIRKVLVQNIYFISNLRLLFNELMFCQLQLKSHLHILVQFFNIFPQI